MINSIEDLKPGQIIRFGPNAIHIIKTQFLFSSFEDKEYIVQQLETKHGNLLLVSGFHPLYLSGYTFDSLRLDMHIIPPNKYEYPQKTIEQKEIKPKHIIINNYKVQLNNVQIDKFMQLVNELEKK